MMMASRFVELNEPSHHHGGPPQVGGQRRIRVSVTGHTPCKIKVMRAFIWKVLWIANGSLFTFISAWNVPLRSKSSLVKTATKSRAANDNECEEDARDIATNILQSALVPGNATKAERALKVALRSISDGQLRQRVSQLVLGTSVMRQRHEYIYNETMDSDSTEFKSKIRCMVDLHADYLNDNNGSEEHTLPWPTDPMERIALQYSMPRFLVQSWLDEHGMEGTESLCKISNKPGPITLRRNEIRCSSDEDLISRFDTEEGVELSPPTFAVSGCLRIVSKQPRSIWAISAWKEGWFEVQDVGSQFIVASTELDDDDKVVIDYCAGNGGKSLAMISQLHQINSSATVLSHDVDELRLAQLRGSLSRAGVLNTSIQLLTTSCAEKDLYDEMADVVLVDAPCSSSGVLRRRPSQRWELTQEALESELPRLQLEILRNASRLVKPGGRLVYATCSICRCENDNVAASLKIMHRPSGNLGHFQRRGRFSNSTKSRSLLIIASSCRTSTTVMVFSLHDGDEGYNEI